MRIIDFLIDEFLVGSTCGGPGMSVFAGGGVRDSCWMRDAIMYFLLLFFPLFFLHGGYLGCACLNFHRASVLFLFFVFV